VTPINQRRFSLSIDQAQRYYKSPLLFIHLLHNIPTELTSLFQLQF